MHQSDIKHSTYYNTLLNVIIETMHKPHEFAMLQFHSQVLSVCLELYRA